MHYSAYIKRTQEAASALEGKYVSLAGGFYGVQLMADGAFVLLALDLDGSSGWAVWTENADGETLTDAVGIGWPKLSELAETAYRALIPRG